MVNVDIEKVVDVEKLRHTLDTLTVNPLTIRPMAVHLKELNQVAPLSVESLRVDHVRHVDPLQIDQLNITSLPTVNLTMSQLPALDINVSVNEIIEAAKQSARTGRAVPLPLK